MNPHNRKNQHIELDEIKEILDTFDRKIKKLKARLDVSQKDPAIVLGRAKNHYASRRTREKIFANPKLFGEPAWDMLVDLFISHEEGKNVSITSLSIASCVPTATSYRWIGILEDYKLVYRTADPNDNRRVYVALTDKALRQVRSHFEQYGN